jgi:hypothetical protein
VLVVGGQHAGIAFAQPEAGGPLPCGCPHAGTLTVPYMLAHDQGFRRGLPRRIDDEWSIIDDPSNWSIAITFIAHGFGDPVIASHRTIESIPVTLRRITFGDMIDDLMQVAGPEDLTDAFERYVRESQSPLNNADPDCERSITVVNLNKVLPKR